MERHLSADGGDGGEARGPGRMDGIAGADADTSGERRLRRLLERAGITLGMTELRMLAAGVAAAPPAIKSDEWFELLGRPVDEELGVALRRLLAQVAIGNPEAPGDRGPRLAALRRRLAERGLDGVIVPRADEHQGEYVPARALRLAWLTGFTGSAGYALILRERAALFVDGRYTLQVRGESDEALFEFQHLGDQPVERWLRAALPAGGRVGYDPWLHTIEWVEKIGRATASGDAPIQWVPCRPNPVDEIWTDRPPRPLAPVVLHPLTHAGVESCDKRQLVAARLRDARLAAVVLTQPDSVAWLLNIRGGDVRHCPLPLAFAILDDGGRVTLFIESRKVTAAARAQLGSQVGIRPPEDMGAALDELGRRRLRVGLDPQTAASWLFDRLEAGGAVVDRQPDPCTLMKAIKNPVELAGARACHLRDGVAMIRFLHWLACEAPAGRLDELEAASQLLELRKAGRHFRDLSFATISAAGANGAIVHYRPEPRSNRRLEPGSLYLVDSGAQYLDGTTDITRTVAIGPPTAEQRRHYTLVLKGHAALASARFPRGTTGTQLDGLARRPLWDAGLDYDHGTGHGVGSYLSVHEGPQRISKMASTIALQPGMVLSIEPGYYRAGAYGIRLENLVVVEAVETPEGGEREWLGFEPLTMVPFSSALIQPSVLGPGERRWLDGYHARVRAAMVPPLLDWPEVMAWLIAATEPIGGGGVMQGDIAGMVHEMA